MFFCLSFFGLQAISDCSQKFQQINFATSRRLEFESALFNQLVLEHLKNSQGGELSSELLGQFAALAYIESSRFSFQMGPTRSALDGEDLWMVAFAQAIEELKALPEKSKRELKPWGYFQNVMRLQLKAELRRLNMIPIYERRRRAILFRLMKVEEAKQGFDRWDDLALWKLIRFYIAEDIESLARNKFQRQPSSDEVRQYLSELLAEIDQVVSNPEISVRARLRKLKELAENLALGQRRLFNRFSSERSSPVHESRVQKAGASEGREDELNSEELRRALEKLPIFSSAALKLRFGQGLSMKEIGRVLGSSSGTARNLVNKALEQMKLNSVGQEAPKESDSETIELLNSDKLKLTDRQREVLSLEFIEKLSIHQIANRLNVSRQNIYDLRNRALGKIQSYLEFQRALLKKK